MKNHLNVKNLAFASILMAITIVLAFLPIKTLSLEITLTIIPISIGCVILGIKGGLFLGLVFGLTSFFQCFGYSAFGALMLAENPLYCFLVCVPTRILAAFLTSLIYQIISKKQKIVAEIVACIVMPVLNTIFFMGVLVLCYYNCDFIQNFVEILGAINPINFIVLFVGINGLVEMIAGIVVSFPIVRALNNIKHSLFK